MMRTQPGSAACQAKSVTTVGLCVLPLQPDVCHPRAISGGTQVLPLPPSSMALCSRQGPLACRGSSVGLCANHVLSHSLDSYVFKENSFTETQLGIINRVHLSMRLDMYLHAH